MTQRVFLCAAIILSLSASVPAKDPPLTWEKLESIAKTLIENKAVGVSGPKLTIDNRGRIDFVAAVVNFPEAVNPEKSSRESFAEADLAGELIELQFYRQRLFTQRKNTDFAKPYFDRAEKMLRDRISQVNSPEFNWEKYLVSDERFQTDNVFKIVDECLKAWATREGLDYSGPKAFAGPPAEVLIVARDDTFVRVVPLTTDLILKALGKSRDTYPWENLEKGKKTLLLGSYLFELRKAGATEYQVKSVSLRTTEIDFRK